MNVQVIAAITSLVVVEAVLAADYTQTSNIFNLLKPRYGVDIPTLQARSSKNKNRDVKEVKDPFGRRMPMGVHKGCDDGKTDLSVDWDASPVNYTCYSPKIRVRVNKLPPVLECDTIPPKYVPAHICMNESIVYETPYPTHAGHRPVWAQYGEYNFVPPQRWSHNVEHGGIVMLYHPCAHPLLVEQLKSVVKGCIFKHVITPTNMIPTDRPLVLVAWGCRLKMNTVNEKVVRQFIKTRALKGPEGKYPKDGQFTYGLIEPARIPVGSTREDSKLCPGTPRHRRRETPSLQKLLHVDDNDDDDDDDSSE